jgi:hypothetical protein
MGGTAGLAPEQLAALDRIAGLPAAGSLYLAGGAAVAFHFGHRRSEDVDLFSTSPELDLDALRRDLFAVFPAMAIRGETDVTLKVVAEGAAIDIVRYPYPPLDVPGPGPSGMAVAGIHDLAAMKLAAISHRGIRRDFWDLHVITTSGRVGSSLAEATEHYLRKFGRQESDLYHVYRSLTFFADAETDPLYPAGMAGELWGDIKGYFEREVPKLIR